MTLNIFLTTIMFFIALGLAAAAIANHEASAYWKNRYDSISSKSSLSYQKAAARKAHQHFKNISIFKIVVAIFWGTAVNIILLAYFDIIRLF